MRNIETATLQGIVDEVASKHCAYCYAYFLSDDAPALCAMGCLRFTPDIAATERAQPLLRAPSAFQDAR
jgi:hypothetical protein